MVLGFDEQYSIRNKSIDCKDKKYRKESKIYCKKIWKIR